MPTLITYTLACETVARPWSLADSMKRVGEKPSGGKGTLSGKVVGIKKILDCHAFLLLRISMY